MGTIAGCVRQIIGCIGDNPDRRGLLETPDRVERAYTELFSGYKNNPDLILKEGFDDIASDGLVLIRDIEFYSTCEHHMLPFHGVAHIAYIPKLNGPVLGASKIPRLLDCFAKRLQVQENIGNQVVQAIMNWSGSPIGAACIIEAKHMCICSRGVGKQGSAMITSAMAGVFMQEGNGARQELMALLRR